MVSRGALCGRARGAALGVSLLVVAVTSSPAQAGAVVSGATRLHYIAADEVDWDYAPSGQNQITGEPFDDDRMCSSRTAPDRIGHVYRKALYREYTDGRFTTLKPIPPSGITSVPSARRSTPRSVTRSVSSSRTRRGSRQRSSARRPLQEGREGRRIQRWHQRWRQGRRRCCTRAHPHLYLEGPERAGPGPMDPQLGDVDVPLAR